MGGGDKALKKANALRPAALASLPSWLWKAFVLLALLVIAFEHATLSALSETPTVLQSGSTGLQTEPASWFHEVRAQFVSPVDVMHLSLLHATCTSRRETIVSWAFGANGEPDEAHLFERDDPRTLDELRRCPDVDVYLPTTIRGAGYCEDGDAYVKYLRSRMLPWWALKERFFDPELNRTVGYHELCPRTPMLFMNHYWDSHHESPDWPKDKPIYVMPNIEMGELKAEAYWRVDAVLCKTHGCYDRVTKWYEQEGNPRGAKVFYTRHTTSDIANFAREALGSKQIHTKDFYNVRFTHTAGSSPHKGTRPVVLTWLAHPDLPPLDLYMTTGLFDWIYRDEFGEMISRAANLKLHTGSVDTVGFGKLLAESAFFLCPSSIEGYGHYINHARAAGGVIITTDVHPMNELVTDPATGIYVHTNRATHPDMMLGGEFKGEHGLKGFDGLIGEYSSDDLVVAIKRVLNMAPREREAMAKRAQAKYHEDALFFAGQMKVLSAYARSQLKAEGDGTEVSDPKSD